MPQDRFSVNKMLKLNRYSTLNALQDASNQNIDKAMMMFSNLNPTESVMNNIINRNANQNTVVNPPFPPREEIGQLVDGNQLMLGLALGIMGTVIGGLVLDWLRKKN